MNSIDAVSVILPALVLVGAVLTITCCIPLALWRLRRRQQNPDTTVDSDVPGSTGGSAGSYGSVSGNPSADSASGGANRCAGETSS
jgi:hypothetical protein